jgi:hypothetical protein
MIRYHHDPGKKSPTSEVDDGVASRQNDLTRAKGTGPALHLTMMHRNLHQSVW